MNTLTLPSEVLLKLKQAVDEKKHDVINLSTAAHLPHTTIEIGTRHIPYTYLTIDGPDGIGKTSYLMRLKEKLSTDQIGLDIVFIKEPGWSLGGSAIRTAVLKMDPTDKKNLHTIKELMLNDRMLTHLLLKERIVKNFMKDKRTIIISDRSMLSSVVYQGILPFMFLAERLSDKRMFTNAANVFTEAVNILTHHTELQSYEWLLTPKVSIIPYLDRETCLKRIQERKIESSDEKQWDDAVNNKLNDLYTAFYIILPQLTHLYPRLRYIPIWGDLGDNGYSALDNAILQYIHP